MYKYNCWSYLQHTLNNPIDTSSALGCPQLTCKSHSQGSMGHGDRNACFYYDTNTLLASIIPTCIDKLLRKGTTMLPNTIYA